ncbi:4'-phosphopantetheinyl transferase [Catalinimonas alkaloidigena]|uniref:4'-phosphopantetheinyl transferase family protein n=1 Tax=Catalinimonas alkaloidigena TaxID=1075417 RepID=UPI0024074864|nr:4'-phosphopantetheinyl transferase superfamily protein [Catalinimonas alkaloidigena]MDF9798521.1 4'-phosphopantetheinyl transferase [Catalinimonas alkaloidigena]
MVTVLEVSLVRKNWRGKALVGTMDASENSPSIRHETYLHPEEMAYYQSLRYEKRRKSYLAGRYVAKKSLGRFLNIASLNEILVSPGVFEQPIVRATTCNPPSISISHTENMAACVVFPREHPMGLDIETIEKCKAETIESQLTIYERQLSAGCEINRTQLYTYLWTAKEALAKLLTTGLLVPMSIYQIEAITSQGRFMVSSFTNFEQYQVISFSEGEVILSIALPKNTQCSFS